MDQARKTTTVRLILPIGIVLFAVLLYLGALYNPLHLDDRIAILQNPDVTEASHLLPLLVSPYQDGAGGDPNLYRPVTVLSYHLTVQWVGERVNALRLSNILLLGIVGWFAAWWFGRYVHPIAAWLAAGLLVAHPANAQLIARVIGRADLLMMLGILGFLLSQRRAFANRQWSLPVSLAAMGFALIAMGAKETGLLIVPLAIIQGWRLRFVPDAPLGSKHRELWMRGILFTLIPLMIYLAGRITAIGLWTPYTVALDDLTGNPLRSLDWMQRLPAALALAWFYFQQLFWPTLVPSDLPAQLPTWRDLDVWLGLGVLSIGLMVLIESYRRRSWVIIALLLALGQYLLVSNLFFPVGIYASNLLTLPFLLTAAAALAVQFEKRAARDNRRRAMAVLLCSAVGIVFIIGTLLATHLSRDPVTLLEARLAQQPGSAATHYRMGVLQFDRGADMTDPSMRATQLGRAARHLEKAVDLAPESIQARMTLAQLYEAMGQPGSSANEARYALELLEPLIEAHPDRPEILEAVRAMQALQQAIPHPLYPNGQEPPIFHDH